MTLHLDVPECAEARCGAITASNARTIVRGIGKSRDSYIKRILNDEPNPGIFESGDDSKLTDARGWGHQYEGEGRAQFELTMKMDHRNWNVLPPPMFWDMDLPIVNVGCSPDGLIVGPGENYLAGLEMKCPYDQKKLPRFIASGLRFIKREEKAWYLQIQMSLWITKLPLWYLCLYDPRWLRRGVPVGRLWAVEVHPDIKTFNAIKKHTTRLRETVLKLKEQKQCKMTPENPAK